MGDRLVDVGICLIQERVRHLDVPFLQLRDGDLLLDELKEQFLFVSNAFPQIDKLVFVLSNHLW